MKLFTYKAETSALALAQAKQELGDECSIISQKKLSDGSYEISVAINEEDLKRAQENKKKEQREDAFVAKNNNIAERLELIAAKELEKRRAANAAASLPEDVSLQLSDAVRQISQIANLPTTMPPPPTTAYNKQETKPALDKKESPSKKEEKNPKQKVAI